MKISKHNPKTLKPVLAEEGQKAVLQPTQIQVLNSPMLSITQIEFLFADEFIFLLSLLQQIRLNESKFYVSLYLFIYFKSLIFSGFENCC